LFFVFSKWEFPGGFFELILYIIRTYVDGPGACAILNFGATPQNYKRTAAACAGGNFAVFACPCRAHVIRLYPTTDREKLSTAIKPAPGHRRLLFNSGKLPENARI
ncbi:MAG: hypothetical protein LBJ24_02635, partial [Treponema sp.]|nr:hypothetical protein [Treponema sp.]